jgi:hypothetical protein
MRKIHAAVTYGNNAEPIGENMNPWTVALRYDGRRMTVPFWTGSGITSDPTAADVLDCLLSDAQMGTGTFEDFCADLGYDTDSRKAFDTWQACERIAKSLPRFLGDLYGELVNGDPEEILKRVCAENDD